jgi:hypothetical protein
LPVNNAFVVYVNNQYVRKGELDLDQLFTKEKLTSHVLQKHASLSKEINKLKRVLRGDMLEIDIGEHCADPYPCDFHGYCWDHVPEYSVLDLSGRTAVPWDLYRRGYLNVEDVPLDLLSEKHKMEVETFLSSSRFISMPVPSRKASPR